MKLTPFGETIRRIEAERMSEAQAALKAGWQPGDHPTKCCPPEAVTPQPKRAQRSIEELERLRTRAANKAKWWADAAKRTQAELDARDAARPDFDHGMLNTPVGPRAREANTTQRIWHDLEYRKGRAKHFDRLEAKYERQIEARP